MTTRTLNAKIQLRASDILLRQAADKAARDGMSLSELVRSAVRKEVARDGHPHKPSAGGAA